MRKNSFAIDTLISDFYNLFNKKDLSKPIDFKAMTYPFEMKDKFVELRASGVTMADATKQLGINYNTGLNWERNLKERIEAYRAIHMEELQEKYLISKEKRIELFGERFLAITEELKKRDLSEISTPKLFEMMIRCMKVLEDETEEPVFLSEAEIERKRDERILANHIEAPGIMDYKRKKLQIKELEPEKSKEPIEIKLEWDDVPPMPLNNPPLNGQEPYRSGDYEEDQPKEVDGIDSRRPKVDNTNRESLT